MPGVLARPDAVRRARPPMRGSKKVRAERERFVRWFLACESARREHGDLDYIPEVHMEQAIEEADAKEAERVESLRRLAL